MPNTSDFSNQIIIWQTLSGYFFIWLISGALKMSLRFCAVKKKPDKKFKKRINQKPGKGSQIKPDKKVKV